MKICFFLQRIYTFTGHALAVWLKEKYGIKDFCGYVQLRSSYEFLKSQKDVNYSSLILDEDVHRQYKKEKLDIAYLQQLEKEYGIPNLWPYLALDREIMSNQAAREYPYNTPKYTHEEMLRILQVTAKNVIAFLDKEKPNFIVFSTIGAVHSLLLYHIAKKRGIKILYILTTSLRDKFVISEKYDSFTDVEKIFQRNLVDKEKNKFYSEAKKLIEDFRKSPIPYDQLSTPEYQPTDRSRQMKFLLPANFIKSVKWFSKLIYEYLIGKTRNDYTYINPWNYLKDHAKRKIRNLIGVSDLYDNFDPKENYAFFALHYEPEISLLLLAPFATDQIHLIRQTAKSLPVGFKLYVKEHPQMVPFRPRSYYKELKKIPNVKLINPSINGLTIVQNAKLIVTITGSVGWEGVMLKKPVIVFGHQFYNALSMIKQCQELEKLPYIIKEQLEKPEYNEEELAHFTAAILEDAATLNFIYLWEKETDEAKRKQGLEPLADLIAKKIGAAQTTKK